MTAPLAFLYPIIHGFKKAGCVPESAANAQVVDFKAKRKIQAGRQILRHHS
jgi:hypothetical protein